MKSQMTLVHVSRVQEALGLNEYQVLGLLNRGELPGVRIEGRSYVPESAVMARAIAQAEAILQR